MDQIERMKKGGRARDPELPHAFVPTPADENIGGSLRPSAACGLCGGSFGNPVHTDNGVDSVQAVRERHGPFGQ
jgi:hypothetical protein